MADSVLHGPVAPVLSLLRHTWADAYVPEAPVAVVVMTMEACCPGFTRPGSHAALAPVPSVLMANPLGITQTGIPTTLTLAALVMTTSS